MCIFRYRNLKAVFQKRLRGVRGCRKREGQLPERIKLKGIKKLWIENSSIKKNIGTISMAKYFEAQYFLSTIF